MALTVINGKICDSSKTRIKDKIRKNSLYLTASDIVVEPQGTNSFDHADVILCAMNITTSHEPKSFTLMSDKDTNFTEVNQEPELIDATDKFFGVDPSLDSAEKSKFYEEDDQLTESQRRMNPRKKSSRQVNFLIADIILRNTTSVAVFDKKMTQKIINPYLTSQTLQKADPI